jgi:hypothetical protein
LRVGTQAVVLSALPVGRCGETACVLRRGVATTGGGLWHQAAVLCLLPVLIMSVRPCPMPCPCAPAANGPKAEVLACLGACSATRQLRDKLQRPILGAQGVWAGETSWGRVCRRHACPLAPRVLWLAGFETVRSALDPGPGLFTILLQRRGPGPHAHMPTTPTASST